MMLKWDSLGEGDGGTNQQPNALGRQQHKHDGRPIGKEGSSIIAQPAHEVDDEDEDCGHGALDGQVRACAGKVEGRQLVHATPSLLHAELLPQC